MWRMSILRGEMMRIYILCPYKLKTGGPELAHQLCAELCQQGQYARMVYYKNDEVFIDGDAADVYQKYNTSCETDMEMIDNTESLVIFVETTLLLMQLFHKCKKAVWWMSVDNYVVQLGMDFSEHRHEDFCTYIDSYHIREQKNVLHLVQSYYADAFLRGVIGIESNQIVYLSDYINDTFVENAVNSGCCEKKDIVMFNPKKGYDQVKQLIECAPEIHWMPIMNMTPEEVAHNLSNAKVYIDFGNHPGKDRIPREAAISGCCVITNKKGAAAFFDDVPIPDMYKFDDVEKHKDDIITLITDIFQKFQEHSQHFQQYRQMIQVEKQWFREDVGKLIERIVK